MFRPLLNVIQGPGFARAQAQTRPVLIDLSRKYMHLWKEHWTQRVFVHLLQRQSRLFSVQSFGCSTAGSRQDCRLRCNHTTVRGGRERARWQPVECLSAWLPGDDEGGARTGLRSSRRHPAGAPDAGDGGRDQAVDVRVDVQGQVAVFPSSNVHQHDGIAKVQKPVICDGYVHLKTHRQVRVSSSLPFLSYVIPLFLQIQVTGLRMLYLR